MSRRKPMEGQITIFDFLGLFMTKKKSNAAPRAPLEAYGLTKQRCKELSALIRSGEYSHFAYTAAQRTSETLAPWIIKSIVEKLSYDDLERMWTLKEIERMPVGRSDFYGYQRKFFYYFYLEILGGHLNADIANQKEMVRHDFVGRKERGIQGDKAVLRKPFSSFVER